MRSTFSSFLQFFTQQSKPAVWGFLASLVLVLGILDYLTGFELSFSLFYILPVSVAAWTLSARGGYLVGMASALTWGVANLVAGQAYSSPVILVWNVLMRLGFFSFITFLLAELHEALAFERTLARTDALTGILNRRAFMEMLKVEIERIKRHQRPATLLYVDIDNFKTINDQHGHQAGDQLLEMVAQTILKNIRAIDTVARLGGDEFVVLLPETGETGAKTIAPRLRWHLLSEMEKGQWPITFSLGALTFRTPPEDIQVLIRQADQLMYKVKNESKDGISYAVL
ncbi:MAG: hypothetical protein Fur0022_13790 [Anaerolineales bacterium]